MKNNTFSQPILKFSLGNFKALIVSLSLIYYFTPMNIIGSHEIYPWYFLISILIWPTIRHYILVSFGLISIAIIAFFNLKVSLEFAQIIVVFTFLYWYSQITKLQARKIVYWMEKLLFFLTLFLLMQKLMPNYFGELGSMLSNRDSVVIDERHGGVRGFASEPSYMVMLMIGIGILLWYEKGKLSLKELSLISLSIILCGSITGYLALIIFIFLNIYKYIINSLYFFFLTLKVNKGIVASIIITIIFIVLLENYFVLPVDRLLSYFSSIRENWDGSLISLLNAEKEFGSVRTQELLKPLSKLCCGYFFNGDFDKNYSLYGLLWAFFAPLHLLVFYPLLKENLTPLKIMSIILFVVFGPVLIITLYLGFLKKR